MQAFPYLTFKPSRLVRPRQKLVGLHFQQTAEGALEFEHQSTAGVQIFSSTSAEMISFTLRS